MISGPGCGPCVVNNGALSSKSTTKLVASVTLAQTGSFTVAVRNGSSGTLSNTRTITVIDPPPPPPPVPSVSSVSTNPSSPIEDQTFQITVNGSDFNTSNAQVVLNGPGCGPCVLNNGSMTSKTSTRLVGPVTVSQSGSFTVAVRNGSGGTLSNTRTISVAGGSSGQPTTFINPLASWQVVQDFGVWSSSQGGYHLAEDVRASAGTSVVAAANGTVKLAQVDVQGYGGLIVVEHIVNGDPIETLYGHLSKSRGLKVQVGQNVTKGQLLAYIANDNEDGGSWEPHLHFGVRQGPFSTAGICGHWYWMGYTQQCSGVTHAQYMAAWYDPTAFLNANR